MKTRLTMLMIAFLASLCMTMHAEAATHVVAPGESLWRIAQGDSRCVDATVDLNGIHDRNRIYPGQILDVPCLSTADAPESTASVRAEATGSVRFRIHSGADTKLQLTHHFEQLLGYVPTMAEIAAQNPRFIRPIGNGRYSVRPGFIRFTLTAQPTTPYEDIPCEDGVGSVFCTSAPDVGEDLRLEPNPDDEPLVSVAPDGEFALEDLDDPRRPLGVTTIRGGDVGYTLAGKGFGDDAFNRILQHGYYLHLY